eukprot:COSAG06_NODE_648_length_13415_cov_83.005783_1_plen_542_part_00
MNLQMPIMLPPPQPMESHIAEMLSPTMQMLAISPRAQASDGGGGDPAFSRPQDAGKHRRTQSHELVLAALDLPLGEKRPRVHSDAPSDSDQRLAALQNQIALGGRRSDPLAADAPLGGSAPAPQPQPQPQPTSSVPVSPIQSPQRGRTVVPTTEAAAGLQIRATPKPPVGAAGEAGAAAAAAAPAAKPPAGKKARSPPRLPTAEQLAAWPAELTKPMPATVVARMLLDSRYQPGSRPKTFEPTHGHFVFKELAGSRGCCPQGDRWHNSGGKAGARDMMVKGGAVRVRRRYGSVTKRGAINWRFHEYSLVRKVKTAKKQKKEVQMAPPLRKEGEEQEKEAAAASAIPPRPAVQDVAEEMAAVMAAMSEGQHQHQQQPRPAKDAKATVTGATRAAEEEEEEKWEEDRSCAVFHVMPSRPVRGRPKREEEADQATLWAHVAPGLAWELSQTHISADKTTGCVEKAVQAVNVAAVAAHVALPTPVLVQSSPLGQAPPAAVTPTAVTPAAAGAAAAAAAAARGVVAADAAEGMGDARTAAATSTLE